MLTIKNAPAVQPNIIIEREDSRNGSLDFSATLLEEEETLDCLLELLELELLELELLELELELEP